LSFDQVLREQLIHKVILENGKMDLSDVGVRHAVAFSPLTIKHSIDISPSAVSIAREVRISIIAIVIGVAAISITRTVLSSTRTPAP